MYLCLLRDMVWLFMWSLPGIQKPKLIWGFPNGRARNARTPTKRTPSYMKSKILNAASPVTCYPSGRHPQSCLENRMLIAFLPRAPEGSKHGTSILDSNTPMAMV